MRSLRPLSPALLASLSAFVFAAACDLNYQGPSAEDGAVDARHDTGPDAPADMTIDQRVPDMPMDMIASDADDMDMDDLTDMGPDEDMEDMGPDEDMGTVCPTFVLPEEQGCTGQDEPLVHITDDCRAYVYCERVQKAWNNQCESLGEGFELVSLNSAEEQNAIVDWADMSGLEATVWTGLVKTLPLGVATWRWGTDPTDITTCTTADGCGCNVEFCGWATGEPNNLIDPADNRVVLDLAERQWEAQRGNQGLSYICEGQLTAE